MKIKIENLWMPLVSVLLCVTGCGKTEVQMLRRPAEGGLVLATTLRTAPYSYRDAKTQDCAGIDIEIARAAAAKLGLELVILPKEFPELLLSVKSGEADFAANAITITPARSRDVAFSATYASDGSAFLYRVGEDLPTIPRAARLRIGTMMASTCHFYLGAHNVDPYCYDNYEQAVEEFERGKLDAVFYDGGSVRETAAKSNGAYAASPLENRENYGVAVRKDYPELLKAVNEVIAERGLK